MPLPQADAKDYWVYRFEDRDVANRAAQIMRIWSGEEKDTKKTLFGLMPRRKKLSFKSIYGGMPGGSSPLFIPQIFGMSFAGLGSFLSRIKRKLGWQGTMICSEAVIAAYQLAADEDKFIVAKNSPIKLHSYRTSPMKLDQWLFFNFLDKGHWDLVLRLHRDAGGWTSSKPSPRELNKKLNRFAA